MTRFSAYTSDTSDTSDSDEENYSKNRRKSAGKHPRPSPDAVDDSDEEGESSDSSEDDSPHPSPSHKKQPTLDALVEDDDDEDDEFHHPHEIRSAEGDDDVAAASSRPSQAQTRRDSTIIPRARQLGIDPQKMHVMQTSLFRVPEEAAALKAMNQPTRPPRPPTPPRTARKKHRRDSGSDGLRADSRERSSFAYDVDPLPCRPSRKYARVEISASAVRGSEGAIADAGLTLGRSFRVGWGPRGLLVHLGELCGPFSKPRTSANSSIITKTTLPTSSSPNFSEVTSKLLQHHLSHSPIEPDEEGIPFATPAHYLRFSSFVSLFSPTDRSYNASLFRLGHALFDDIELRLNDSTSIDIRNQLASLGRKATLSAWFEEAVIPAVESDLKKVPSTNSAAAAYTLLTGNQVEKASQKATAGRNVKLATLISQGAGDFEFRMDLREQLRLWKEQRVDIHVDESIRKVYALLAGTVDVVEGSEGTGIEKCPDIDLLKGMDWKRTFGFHLWFSEPLDASIAQVFQSYDRLWKESPSRVTAPLPSYVESPSTLPPPSSSWLPTSTPLDGLFGLIQLHAQPAYSLSHVLSPLSFGPSSLDYSLPWHLYILLSRCIRVRDLFDRGDPGLDVDLDSDGEDEIRIEGHSPSADLLASSYAFQLEAVGMIQEALFVLLHIEGSVGREKAIKDLLFRSAPRLNEWMTRGIVGSLKIPVSWVNEAKAIHAHGKGDIWEAYELYLAAELYNVAHDLAVVELAPEAVIRQDFDLLKNIFAKIAIHSVDGWHTRGKAFLDYVDIMTRLPELQKELKAQDTIPDEIQTSEFEELTRRIPKLIAILPEVLRDRSDPRHNVALAQMISGLMLHLDRVKPLAMSPSEVQPALVDQATTIRHIHSTARERFLRTVEVA